MKNSQTNLRLSLCLLLVIISFVLKAQNLVLNPSFEQGSTPQNIRELHFATNWTHYKGECIPYNSSNQTTWPSSDLFDQDSSNPGISVPNNSWTPSGGLPENNGNRRYAGIYQVSYTPGVTQDERIRGTLSTALQAGAYDLSLFLARAKNFYAPSNPSLDPINFYQVEVVLRQGTSCSQQKLIYTTPNVTSMQWNQFATTFTITSAEANQYDRVEIRLKTFPYNEIGPNNAHAMFIDDVSIERVQCTLDPSFNFTFTCNESTNDVTINMASTATNPVGTAHQYNVYEMNSMSTLDNDIVSFLGFVGGTPNSYVIPNIPGKFYMIKHGVWSDHCTWTEQRQVFRLPAFTDPVDSDFAGAIISPPSPASPTINVQAASINQISRWVVFTSTINYPTLAGWNLHSIITPGPFHSYSFTNIQNGRFYWVRHISKNNCSQFEYTDKIFFVMVKSLKNGEQVAEYELIDSSKESITEEQYVEMMEEISYMEPVKEEIQNAELYPNPSSDYVSIDASTEILEGSYVTVRDQVGTITFEGEWSIETKLDVSSWKKGIYYVDLVSREGTKKMKLIVE